MAILPLQLVLGRAHHPGQLPAVPRSGRRYRLRRGGLADCQRQGDRGEYVVYHRANRGQLHGQAERDHTGQHNVVRLYDDAR